LAELEETTYILGIEEPEQNLHPQAQRELLESLRKLPMQVLFTTHSTVILDQLKHDEVVLCRRIPSTTRGVEVITTQLDSSFWSANGLDEDRYYQFYRRSNSEFFFSNFVILTESSVDAEILKELLQQGNVDPTAYGVSILSLDGVTSLPYAFHLFKALDLDFATVVDKDYFMPYLNDALETSRDSGGFPRYRKEYKSTTVLNQILPNVADRTTLLELLHSNHSRAMDMLEKSNVFCFKWSIEIDLVNSLTARQLLFDKFHVSVDKQNTVELLVNKKGVLKKLETLMPVVRALQPSNLPNSYKRLRKTLPEIIKIAVSIS
jgi:predicted ATP-dependent endonuclease of OLD family